MNGYDMKQCALTKSTKQGKSYIVSWIPASYARLGRIVKVKEGNVWLEGWTVSNVYNLTKKSDEVLRDRDHYRTQRQASDVFRR